MATVASLLAKLGNHLPTLQEDRVPAHSRKELILEALREHSRVRPRHVIEEGGPSDPSISEFVLPVAFGEDDRVIKIESPVDQDREHLMERDTEYREVRTPTGYKVFFVGKSAEKFRITYTLQWTEATLSLMPAADEDMVAWLAASGVALAVAAAYADTIQGEGGSPADLVSAQAQEAAWTKVSEKALETYHRLVHGDEDHPRGVLAKGSPGGTRRDGFPHRRHMPRGQIYRGAGF